MSERATDRSNAGNPAKNVALDRRQFGSLAAAYE